MFSRREQSAVYLITQYFAQTDDAQLCDLERATHDGANSDIRGAGLEGERVFDASKRHDGHSSRRRCILSGDTHFPSLDQGAFQGGRIRSALVRSRCKSLSKRR